MRLPSCLILCAGLRLAAAGCDKMNAGGSGGKETSPPGPPAKGDEPRAGLEGTYLVVGVNFNGTEIPADELKQDPEAERTVVIKGNKFVGKMGLGPKEEEFKTDATTTPAQIDFTAVGADGKARTMLGIYKLEGDQLTLAVANDPQQPPKNRPKDFNPGKGSFILMLKRK